MKLAAKRSHDNPVLAAFIYDSVLKDAHFVGEDLHGNKRYATQDYKHAEASCLQLTHQLSSDNHTLSIFQKTIANVIEQTTLAQGYAISAEQESAIYAACEDRRLSVMVGRAGTGKTTSLKSIVRLHEMAGFTVVGMALSAEAARHLGEDAKITSKTLASNDVKWRRQEEIRESLKNESLNAIERRSLELKLADLSRFDFDKNTLAIVDECGMIGTAMMNRLLAQIEKSGAKLFLVGDDRQFKAIDAGDIFRKQLGIAKTLGGYSELTHIFRQQEKWMVEASLHLSELDAHAALNMYHDQGCVHGRASEETALVDIADLYMDRVASTRDSGLVITYTNESCNKLNAEIRSRLLSSQKISPVTHTLKNSSFSVGDRILFLENCYDPTIFSIKRLPVSKGTSVKSVRTIEKSQKSLRGHIPYGLSAKHKF